MTANQTYLGSGKFLKDVTTLSLKAGLPMKFELIRLEGGRNNGVFCVDYGDKKALLKAYFQHPNDPRDRLRAEYSFLSFARSNNVKCLPNPIIADFQNNLGLYEFIDGRKLAVSEIDKEKIAQALHFFKEINQYGETPKAQVLPHASEACFSVEKHLEHIEKRLEKLKKINGHSEIDYKAISFVQGELLQGWQKAVGHAMKLIRNYNIDPNKKILPQDICISPSDFGYHNALLNKNNKIYFIDFEYAGLDDPAKMVCDFFCQTEIQVPFKYFDLFVKAVSNEVSNPDSFEYRIRALLPAYKIKWCCIILNDFLDIGAMRRNFAYGKLDLNERRANQLEKAQEYFHSLNFEAKLN